MAFGNGLGGGTDIAEKLSPVQRPQPQIGKAPILQAIPSNGAIGLLLRAVLSGFRVGPVDLIQVALAIGRAGDVTDCERIALGRYERTELLPIRLGQKIKTTPPSAPPPRKCAKRGPRQATAFAPTTPSPARAMITAALR
jgi:hypothetical protein